jgi:hypothetical protein
MANAEGETRIAGVWLAIASILLAGALVGHGPIHPDMSRQMGVIADGPVRWAIIHWGSAVSLSLFALTGLIVLAARSRLTEAWWTMSAWGVLTVGALWTMTTAVAEATVVSAAAAAGDTATFEAWWAFSEGKANGFMFLALAVAVIAGNEAQTTHGATPAWASYIAVVAGSWSPSRARTHYSTPTDQRSSSTPISTTTCLSRLAGLATASLVQSSSRSRTIQVWTTV